MLILEMLLRKLTAADIDVSVLSQLHGKVSGQPASLQKWSRCNAWPSSSSPVGQRMEFKWNRYKQWNPICVRENYNYRNMLLWICMLRFYGLSLYSDSHATNLQNVISKLSTCLLAVCLAYCSTLQLEAIRSSEILVSLYWTTRCQVSHLMVHGGWILASATVLYANSLDI